ncbi:MAG: hypothetical protein D6824_09625 [Planctomycetota bacterium]|nr:MAG: hypothetical protein D6824_09625 [Planctomycetota bacterium]
MTLAHRLGILFAVVVAAALTLGALDYALRFPAWVRGAHLVLGGGGLLFALWRWVLAAARLRPDPASLALRLERRRPELRGVLAAAVDLTSPAAMQRAGALERALALRVARAAMERWRSEAVRDVVRLEPALQGAALTAVAAATLLAVTLVSPQLTRTGAQRLFMPWKADAQWPRRTAVADAVALTVHPRGVALPLRAALLRSTQSPERTDVYVRYRYIRNGQAGPFRRELLMYQRQEALISDPAKLRRAGVGTREAHGALFERIVDADAEGLEYSFETADDATPLRRIQLIEPPRVVEASARIDPPVYAAAAQAPLEVDLGDGRDERAVAPAALAGSTVALTLRLNKPVAAKQEDKAWLAEVFSDEALAAVAPTLSLAEEAEDVWTLRFVLEDAVRLPVRLKDEYGLAALDPSVFRFRVVQDAPPSVAFLEPEADKSVLPTAVVPLHAEARDDVGLAKLAVTMQLATPEGASGPGGALTPHGPPRQLAVVEGQGEALLERRLTLDLAPLGLSPGDEVRLEAQAVDLRASVAASPEPRLASRTLRVISQTQFVEEMQRALGAIRQDAIRIDERQKELIERLERIPPRLDDARRGQAVVTRRIERQEQAVERLTQRIDENALDDEALQQLLQQAKQLLQRARARSEASQNALDEAAQRQQALEEREDQGGAAPDDQERAALQEQLKQGQRAQEQVRADLRRLAELLDRGEDAWVSRRKLEDLARAQAELAQQSGQLARQTAGKTQDELTPQQRSELARIAEAQARLAEQARQTTEELLQKAQELREQDPAAAQGLARAAQRSRERRVAQTMEQAAQEAQRNQLGQASRTQRQAQQDLEQMLRDLEQGQQEREQVLRRALASLLDAIDSLIRSQEAELRRLEQARNDDTPRGLDQGMIALNANALGVLDEASQAGPELAPVADLLGQAVDAQTRAIVALRPKTGAPRLEEAQRREGESLDLLKQAYDEARRIEQELAEKAVQRQRDQLRAMYLDLLAQQIELRDAAASLAEKRKLSRRDRRESEKLAQRQRGLADALQEAVATMEGLDEAQVLQFANDAVAGAFADAADALAQASPAQAVPPQSRAVSLLQGIVKALRQQKERDDELRDAPGAGGGGGNGNQQRRQIVPPLAELRILRELQADLAQRTRLAAEHAQDSDVVLLGQEQEQLKTLGEALIERLQRQQGPGAAPGAGPGRRPGDGA